MLQRVKREDEITKKANFEDRGVGTIMNGYTTTDEIADVNKFFLDENSPKDLRNGLAFLLSHFCLLRGESAHKAEFPDLQLIQLEGEGADKCPALVMVMRQGKTNKFGKLEVGACIRNKRVEICPFMRIGMSLFARFHVEGEPFPDFTISENWFQIKVLKHLQDPRELFPYQSHLSAITKAFEACNITSSKKNPCQSWLWCENG